MNKELKKEAEDYADKWIKHAIDHKSLTYWNSCVDGYIAGSEPREKHIRKAKDLIRRLITIYCDQIEYDEDGNTLEEARQFLKE